MGLRSRGRAQYTLRCRNGEWGCGAVKIVHQPQAASFRLRTSEHCYDRAAFVAELFDVCLPDEVA